MLFGYSLRLHRNTEPGCKHVETPLPPASRTIIRYAWIVAPRGHSTVAWSPVTETLRADYSGYVIDTSPIFDVMIST